MQVAPGNPLGPTVEGGEINIPSAAQGDIIIRNATTWTRLGTGTNGQVLTAGGAGTEPAWASLATVPVNAQSDAAAKAVVGDAGYHAIKTFTFTAPADCVVLGYAWSGDLAAPPSGSLGFKLNDSVNGDTYTQSAGGSRTTGAFKLNAPAGANSFFVASAGTFTVTIYGYTGDNGHGDGSISNEEMKFVYLVM